MDPVLEFWIYLYPSQVLKCQIHVCDMSVDICDFKFSAIASQYTNFRMASECGNTVIIISSIIL